MKHGFCTSGFCQFWPKKKDPLMDAAMRLSENCIPSYSIATKIDGGGH
jgi:hypothetical protein